MEETIDIESNLNYSAVDEYLESCFKLLTLAAMRMELNEEWELLNAEIYVST